METKKDLVFAISKVGAKHLPKGVPCQDFSTKWEDENMQVIIVCDGHGSPTYVRSDVGARLAAEVAEESIREFVKQTAPSLFLGKKGAVTARPDDSNDSLWGGVSSKSMDEMSEIELNNFKQNKAFFEQVKDIREQDSVMVALFQSICKKWKEAISKDSEGHPFTDSEKAALGNNRLEKAYGSTLMAFVKTPYYWFAFHIGDGRLIAVDRHLDMTQPVPWDCNCFQNFTTSLCNTEPVKLFRYAFDGTGHFPTALFCCSDGIEDSWGDYEASPNLLHNFYRGLLDQFVKTGTETTLKNIEDFLPVLSQKGSGDDMSLAGIINLDALQDGLEEQEIRAEICKLQEKETQIKARIDETCAKEIAQWTAKVDNQ